MSEKTILTKLRMVSSYQFNVDFDVPYIPNLLVDETKPEGEGAGPNPPRLLAVAVGHCLSSSLIYCLKKARITPRNLETSVKTNLFRNENGRLRIRSIDVQISLVVSEEDKTRVNRCLNIFEDYCTVTQSVRKGIEVNVNIK